MHVTIVSANPETLANLHAYLRRVGIASSCSRLLRDLETISTPTTAVIIFPDDFGDSAVQPLLRQLRRTRPHLLTLLVTGEPQRFQAVAQVDGRTLAPVVLPKPTFGWEILDALRAHRNGPPDAA